MGYMGISLYGVKRDFSFLEGAVDVCVSIEKGLFFILLKV
jgi:hypothetical protein